MKKFIQALLQRLLGFRNYLFVFALYKSKTIESDRKEGDFSYFLSLIKPDSIVLDIGANVGIMTTNLAKKLTQGKVYAFEPIPDNIATLKRLLAYYRLNNVTLFEYALGNETRQTRMVLPVVQAVKMQGLAHMIDKSITEFNDGITFSVPQFRLDDISDLQGKQISAIKIDVENFEYQVFLGAIELIKSSRPVIYCELWDNDNRKQCLNLMNTLNYQICVLVNGNLMPYDPIVHSVQNFFFLPRN